MNKKEKQIALISQHGKDLLAIFPNATIKDPIKLCKRLLSLENKAKRLTLDECNTGADHSEELNVILRKVFEILAPTPDQKEAIFVNGDPRGYALKIDFIFARNLQIFKDWGGYGILAPLN